MPQPWWPDLVWRLLDEPAFLALSALIFDRLWPRRRAGPPPRLRLWVQSLARRLDRPQRGATIRRFRGGLLWLVALVLGVAGGLALHYVFGLAETRHAERVAQGLVLAWAVAYRPARATADRAIGGLREMAAEGRALQARRVAEVACSRLASRFADGALGTVMFFLIFGWAGLFGARFTQLCAASVAGRDSHSPFDLAVAAWADRLAALPAWFAAALVGRPSGRIASGYESVTTAVAALPSVIRVEDDPPARVARTRRAVEQGWWLWCLILILGGIAAEFWTPFG